jgi:hypothetical protein
MLSDVAKRGVYPTHSYRLGLYRLPVTLTDESTITNIANEIKKMDLI